MRPRIASASPRVGAALNVACRASGAAAMPAAAAFAPTPGMRMPPVAAGASAVLTTGAAAVA